MANRYWVLGTGLWSDSSHWSASSNGAGGASIPTSTDNVFFNEYSFSATGQVVTADLNPYCLDMDWTGVLYTPTFAGGTTRIYGNILLSSSMLWTNTGIKYLLGTSNRIINFNGVSTTGTWYIDGVGGYYTLLSNWTNTSTSTIYVRNGTLDTNNFNLTTASDFSSIVTNLREIIFGSSIISIGGNFTLASTNLTFSPNTSTIKMTGTLKAFNGDGLVYNNLEINNNNITITGSNTFNDLKISQGRTLKFTSGTTQTISTMSGSGVSGSLITIQSTAAGTPYTINKISGDINLSYYSIKDCIATGGATFTSLTSNGCVDATGNTGWTFSLGAAPVITIISYTETKLSNQNTKTLSTVVFQSDIDIIEWEARADGAAVGQGDLVGNGAEALANTDISFDIDYTELVWGDKTYRINIYGKNSNGSWTAYG